MSKYEEVITVLEAAKGPAPELDALIECAVGKANYAMAEVTPIGASNFVSRGGEFWEHAPAYTSSIDAALTLVPDGFYWTVSRGVTTDVRGPFWSEVYSYERGIGFWEHEPAIYGAPTPALAVCISALKSRAEEM